ncbi:MAG: hypothetical protein Greene041662_544 [Candidatus Peregrinibacteria bacterium Greene0416_62]|nr:MAG: hypothetical protein Greene041662_544 [Candidatus Peregrinibacteria bacterium Greene0416_62]TSC99412.1 MAG: hypothetical protein Greene101449_623 [Candidatus Peregrinibacteria bacterium Greene1014_49]
MVENAHDALAELKRQQVCEGQKVLAFAARDKDLVGHGTGDISYEEILRQGKLIHEKGNAEGNIQYASLAFLGGWEGQGPMDQGNGLFVLDPIAERDVSHKELFVKSGTQRILDLRHIRWIVLPKCEVDFVRSPLADDPLVEEYRGKIVTYEELAAELGYDPDHNRVTPEIATFVEQFRQELGERLVAQAESERTAEAIRNARLLVERAAAKGAAGIVEAGLILDELYKTLPEAQRVVYERTTQPEATRITAVDNTWYAILEAVDRAQGTYKIYLRDRRKGRNIVVGRSRIRTDTMGTFFE